MKLDIGSGGNRLDETWTTLDIRALANVDFVCSSWYIPLEDNSVDEIRTRHMIEHLTYLQGKLSLKEWHRILKPGGVINIICPDRDYAVRQIAGVGLDPEARSVFVMISNKEAGLRMLPGWQTYPEDTHQWSWNSSDLKEEMKKVGFIELQDVADRECDIHVRGTKKCQ